MKNETLLGMLYGTLLTSACYGAGVLVGMYKGRKEKEEEQRFKGRICYWVLESYCQKIIKDRKYRTIPVNRESILKEFTEFNVPVPSLVTDELLDCIQKTHHNLKDDNGKPEEDTHYYDSDKEVFEETRDKICRTEVSKKFFDIFIKRNFSDYK